MKLDLLRYGVAYRLQERTLGGLKPSTRRSLERVADDMSRHDARESCGGAKTRGGYRAGSQMGRRRSSGKGGGDGVPFRGKRHRSLSEVAHLITGQSLVGPAVLRAAWTNRNLRIGATKLSRVTSVSILDGLLVSAAASRTSPVC